MFTNTATPNLRASEGPETPQSTASSRGGRRAMRLLVASVLTAIALHPAPSAARYRREGKYRFQREDPTAWTNDVIELDSIVARVQRVLCDNFPSIPCQFIIQDDMLRKLIKKSITQIKKKGPSTEAPPSTRADYFPVVDSEDLSKFLEVKHTGYFDAPAPKKAKKQWAKDMRKKKPRQIHRGRGVIRTYYPHKIKYKVPKTFVKDSDEASASAEVMRQERKVTSEPIWKIDYTKHGEPSLSPLNYQRPDYAKDYNNKLMKGINDEEFTKHEAREVMRSKMYINSARKSQLIRSNDSGDMR